MRWANLLQTRSYSRRPLSLAGLWICGLIAALIIPLLVCDFGLIVHWLISRDNGVDTNSLVFATYQQLVGGDSNAIMSPGQQFAVLTVAGAVLIVVEAIFLLLHQRTILSLAQEVDAALKRKTYRQVIRIGPADTFARGITPAEELMNEHTETVRKSLVAWWRVIPYGVVLLLGLLGVALAINFWLATTAILLGIVIWIIYRNIVRPRAREHARAWEERAERHRNWLNECLSVVHMATSRGEGFPGLEFEHELHEYQRASFRAHLSHALRRPFLLSAILLAALFLVTIVGMATEGRVSAAASVTLASALICAYFPAASIFRLPRLLDEGETAASKLLRFHQRGPAVLEAVDTTSLDKLTDKINVHAVTLADGDGKSVLSNLSVEIEAGSRVAIMSDDELAPGALARLLLRHGDPAAGSISFDDCELRNAKLAHLRSKAVGIERGGKLFSASVEDNITLGDESVLQAQIVELTKLTGAHDFIQSLPDAYATVLGTSGQHVPAIEAFRITLARALLHDPTVLVLEEPRAAFDESQKLDEQLQVIAKERTVVVLPSSIVSLRNADNVIFLHKGDVVERGTHSEVLQRSELYRHIIYQRFNPFREDEIVS